MPIRKIIKFGNPILSWRAKEIDDVNTAEIASLVEDMIDTMQHHDGAGIAAPQIGISKRLVIFGFDKNPRYPEALPVPYTILANPEYEAVDDETDYKMEGCLSIPGIRGKVLRFKKIKYSGFDMEKKCKIDRVAEGFHARVVQHEIDHLNGILFLQRVLPEDFHLSGFEDELSEL